MERLILETLTSDPLTAAMSFATNTLPEEFQQEHGSVDLGAGSSKDVEDASHPDEDLDLDRAGNRVWLCKVPRFLMDKWNEQAEQGAILGRVRVYDEFVSPLASALLSIDPARPSSHGSFRPNRTGRTRKEIRKSRSCSTIRSLRNLQT